MKLLNRAALAVAPLLVVFPFSQAAAETGLYAGGGVGNAGVELDFQGTGLNLPNFRRRRLRVEDIRRLHLRPASARSWH